MDNEKVKGMWGENISELNTKINGFIERGFKLVGPIVPLIMTKESGKQCLVFTATVAHPDAL